MAFFAFLRSVWTAVWWWDPALDRKVFLRMFLKKPRNRIPFSACKNMIAKMFIWTKTGKEPKSFLGQTNMQITETKRNRRKLWNCKVHKTTPATRRNYWWCSFSLLELYQRYTSGNIRKYNKNTFNKAQFVGYKRSRYANIYWWNGFWRYWST